MWIMWADDWAAGLPFFVTMALHQFLAVQHQFWNQEGHHLASPLCFTAGSTIPDRIFVNRDHHDFSSRFWEWTVQTRWNYHPLG
jgi:hypothetical protein